MTFRDIPAVRKKYVVEAQWSDMPEEVCAEVRDLWYEMRFGNDDYYYTWSKEDFLAAEDEKYGEEFTHTYPKIAAYLRSQGLDENDDILIHFWW